MKESRTARARSLRKSETDAEHKLWLRLRDRRLSGHKFVRQMPLGPFFADFACREANLIVELDGGQHAESTRDRSRDVFLNAQSYAVLRFWNNEVFATIDAVCETIVAAVEGRLEAHDRYSVPSSALSGTFSPQAGRRGSRHEGLAHHATAMKTIGLIGGTSWESTAVYYRLLNEGVRRRLGGLHSARVVLVSVDFAPLAEAMAGDRWDVIADTLALAARQLEAAGADCIALCTNTMHKVAGPVAAATSLPFVDLVDVTGAALVTRRSLRPLLLATRYTMEQDFYRERLRDRFGVAAMVPAKPAREALQRIIFEELCQGRILTPAKAAVLAMIADAARDVCDGVIFGCTEIGLLIAQADIALPVFDTTSLHCEALLDFALNSLPLATSHAA